MFSSRKRRIDRAARRQARQPGQRRRGEPVVASRQQPGGEEEGEGGHEIGVEIPVPDRHAAPRMVAEDVRVQRQADEHGGEQAGRPGEQAAVGDAPVEGGEGGGEERPADGDPLAVELEGDRRRDAGEHRAGDQREPPVVPFREDPSGLSRAARRSIRTSWARRTARAAACATGRAPIIQESPPSTRVARATRKKLRLASTAVR